MKLLDTHALIWLAEGSTELGQRARAEVDAALRDEKLSVSAMSFWEAANMSLQGRVRFEVRMTVWRRRLLALGLLELPVTGDIAITAAALGDFFGDTADRIIIATAQLHAATLVTADQRLLTWRGAVDRIDARR